MTAAAEEPWSGLCVSEGLPFEFRPDQGVDIRRSEPGPLHRCGTDVTGDLQQARDEIHRPHGELAGEPLLLDQAAQLFRYSVLGEQ